MPDFRSIHCLKKAMVSLISFKLSFSGNQVSKCSKCALEYEVIVERALRSDKTILAAPPKAGNFKLGTRNSKRAIFR